MIVAVVFIIVFVFWVLLTFIGISLPPGNVIIQEFIPNLIDSDYSVLTGGIINGVIYGIIILVYIQHIKDNSL